MDFHVTLLITAVSCHHIGELVFSVQQEEDDRFSTTVPHESMAYPAGTEGLGEGGAGQARRASSSLVRSRGKPTGV